MKIHVNIPFSMLKKRLKRFSKFNTAPEVYFNSKALDRVNRVQIKRLREALDKEGLDITIHAPYMDLSPGALDERIRAVTVERFKQVLNIASILKPLAIVFHPGYDRWRYNGHEATWLKQSLKTWRPLVERAKKLGLLLAIENVFEERPDTLKALINAIGSDNIKICFDIGHFTLFSQVSLEEWYEALSPFIVELHLHDNHGKEDDHIAIGDGVVNFKGLFRLLEGHPLPLIYTFEPHREEDLSPGLDKLKSLLKEANLWNNFDISI